MYGKVLDDNIFWKTNRNEEKIDTAFEKTVPLKDTDSRGWNSPR